MLNSIQENMYHATPERLRCFLNVDCPWFQIRTRRLNVVSLSICLPLDGYNRGLIFQKIHKNMYFYKLVIKISKAQPTLSLLFWLFFWLSDKVGKKWKQERGGRQADSAVLSLSLCLASICSKSSSEATEKW